VSIVIFWTEAIEAMFLFGMGMRVCPGRKEKRYFALFDGECETGLIFYFGVIILHFLQVLPS